MDINTLTYFGFGVTCGIACTYLVSIVKNKGRSKATNILTQAASNVSIMSESDEYKLVIAVRTDLKMGKGKVAAQCAHAAALANQQVSFKHPKLSTLWAGQQKVIVQAKDEKCLYELAMHAKRLGLNASLIADAGRTQIAPGSKTVIGVGPGPKDLVDQVTSHLKLY